MVKNSGQFLVFFISIFLLLNFLATEKVDAAVLSRAPNNLGLVGYWPMNEGVGTKAGDSSGQGNTGSITGATWTSGKHGKALSFDGNDYINVSNSSSLNSSLITVAVWVNPTSFANYKTIAIKTTSSSWNDGWGLFHYTGANDIRFFINGYNANYVSANIPIGSWSHITGTFDGSLISIYTNGTLTATSTYSGSINTSSNILQIGSGDIVGGGFWNGKIDDVRIYNRALTASEVAKLYKAGAAKVAASSADLDNGGTLDNGLVGLWTMDGKDTVWTSATAATTLDKSGLGNTGTLTNMSRTTSPTIGKLGQGLMFDGVNSSINIASPTTITTPFSVSVWTKYQGNGTRGTIFDYEPSGLKAWSLGIKNNTEAIFTKRNIADLSLNIGSWPTGWFQTVWVVGSDNDIELFINGVSKGKFGNTTAFATNGDNIVKIGIGNSSTNPFNGSIDDVRIYSRALTASEIKQLYNLGGDKINTSPTTKLTSGLVGYWTFDGKDTNWTGQTTGTVADKSGLGNTGTLTNMSRTSSPTIGKIGQGLKFDGVDDYINTASTVNFGGTKVVTVSFWMYKTAFTNTDLLTMELSSNYNDNDGTFFIDPNASGGYFNVGLQDSASTNRFRVERFTRPSTNNWHYYTIVFDNSTVTGDITSYVDGVPQAENLSTNNKDQSSNVKTDTLYFMSRGGTSLFNSGLLDEVRIYNRALSASEVKQLYNMGR